MHRTNTVGEELDGTAEHDSSPTPGANNRESLRTQVQELLAELLADTTPGQAHNRSRLLASISKHPGRPEAALLEHLMNRSAATTPGTGLSRN